MEEKERLIILKLAETNQEIKKLWEQHLEYEKRLKEFDKKPYLSPEDDTERKEIQKLKLSGKDKMFEILSKSGLRSKLDEK
ncbi:MAG: DUF465 domain-containing protein [Deltaproteobacteria bacterium]|nr:DUF465 domain-containing protein [Deltaproteobacteria bacterium]MCL5791954.1 DUF465 domain-containing protein [Deltaproteobacteria bacterium]